MPRMFSSDSTTVSGPSRSGASSLSIASRMCIGPTSGSRASGRRVQSARASLRSRTPGSGCSRAPRGERRPDRGQRLLQVRRRRLVRPEMDAPVPHRSEGLSSPRRLRGGHARFCFIARLFVPETTTSHPHSTLAHGRRDGYPQSSGPGEHGNIPAHCAQAVAGAVARWRVMRHPRFRPRVSEAFVRVSNPMSSPLPTDPVHGSLSTSGSLATRSLGRPPPASAARSARPRDPRRAAAVPLRPRRPRRGLVPAGVQPRSGHPGALLLSLPSRDEGGSPTRGSRRRPLAGRSRRPRRPRPALLGNLAEIDHLRLRPHPVDRRARAHLSWLGARPGCSGPRSCTSSSCCRCRSSSTGSSPPRCSSSPR